MEPKCLPLVLVLRALICLGIVLCGASAAMAMPGYPSDILNSFSAEPEPFRRDEIDGRVFEYSDESFLHRFNYRIPLDWQLLWDRQREGFIITAGSTRSDELFVNHLLRKTITLNETFFGILRHQRSEDFDTRYDRFLTGVGVHLMQDWSFAVLGNIVAEKEDIDPQFELTWDDSAGDRFRIALVLTDYLYNRKNNEDGSYTKKPYTVFSEGKWALSENLVFSAWVNWNSDLRLRRSDDSRFSYDQFMAEAAVLWKPAENWEMLFAAGTQTGDRAIDFPDSSQRQREHLDRDNAVATVETQYRLSPTLKSVHGMHYFFLDEEGYYRNTLPEGGKNERREYMPFAGLRWRVGEEFGISPTVYLDFVDLENPAEPGEAAESSRKALGKLALPLEYYFSQTAMMTFDVTMELHKVNFGGFDVQFVVLF